MISIIMPVPQILEWAKANGVVVSALDSKRKISSISLYLDDLNSKSGLLIVGFSNIIIPDTDHVVTNSTELSEILVLKAVGLTSEEMAEVIGLPTYSEYQFHP